jgi:hypothetical protein
VQDDIGTRVSEHGANRVTIAQVILGRAWRDHLCDILLREAVEHVRAEEPGSPGDEHAPPSQKAHDGMVSVPD